MKLSALCTTLAVMAFGFISVSAHADGGVEIVKYHCMPEQHSVYVGTAIVHENTDDFGEGVIEMGPKLVGDEKTLECQLSAADKAVIHVGQSHEYPRNNNVQIKINGRLFKSLSFSPGGEVYYLITADNNKITAQSFIKTVRGEISDWAPSASK
jgi:hypothetical protein